MKKVKMSSLKQENRVDKLTNILGFDAAGLVKTVSPIGDFQIAEYVIDANTLHESFDTRCIVARQALNTSLNVPNAPGTGVLIHIQRNPGSLITTAQIIGQMYFTGVSVYIRSGKGNGTAIEFSTWKLL